MGPVVLNSPARNIRLRNILRITQIAISYSAFRYYWLQRRHWQQCLMLFKSEREKSRKLCVRLIFERRRGQPPNSTFWTLNLNSWTLSISESKVIELYCPSGKKKFFAYEIASLFNLPPTAFLPVGYLQSFFSTAQLCPMRKSLPRRWSTAWELISHRSGMETQSFA